MRAAAILKKAKLLLPHTLPSSTFSLFLRSPPSLPFAFTFLFLILLSIIIFPFLDPYSMFSVSPRLSFLFLFNSSLKSQPTSQRTWGRDTRKLSYVCHTLPHLHTNTEIYLVRLRDGEIFSTPPRGEQRSSGPRHHHKMNTNNATDIFLVFFFLSVWFYVHLRSMFSVGF